MSAQGHDIRLYDGAVVLPMPSFTEGWKQQLGHMIGYIYNL